MSKISVDQHIVNIILQSLARAELPTSETIRTTVHQFLSWFQEMPQYAYLKGIDEDQFVREIETQCNIFVPAVSSLVDNSDHVEWLSSLRANISWRFWDRYRNYLETTSNMPPQAILRLDDVTNQILSKVENPQRSAPWDRRGMVVGQVQSGKTSNYTALICKAADAGYKLIVVLAGIHNSLRSQTQLRLDEGFLGFDTQKRRLFNEDNIRLGVGLLPGSQLFPANTITNSADDGDFRQSDARKIHIMIGEDSAPVLLVVKKNVSVLNALLEWLTDHHSSSPGNPHIPFLLIDDEADNASINTNPVLDEKGNPDPEVDPSKINGLLRKLLNHFDKSAYIGYTATPFANIFITDKFANEEFGEDLFPRSFIVNLRPPSNYFGPAKVFGLLKDPVTGLELAPDLPLIRPVNDYYKWMPDRHKKEHRPGTLPNSVVESMHAFILSCATRYVRGYTKSHNSMLLHVTRFTAVQERIYDQVREELQFIAQRLRYGDEGTSSRLLDELERLWRLDFEPTMQKFDDPDLSPVTWDQIREILYTVTAKIEVRKINGTAKDTLQYVEHKEGLSVICIGGDKLSRGLTLEGLSVSYYLRASKMYDTLMQMGRWFGYRGGYTDVCRLYTTDELIGWYRDITAADEELRHMFEDMAAQDKTPADYGLGVRKHPDGLLVTARAKMRYSQTVTISYAGHISETIVFSKDRSVNEKNRLAAERLIQAVCKKGDALRPRDNFLWENVPGEEIVRFLRAYTTHEEARTAQSTLLRSYIQRRLEDQELVDWTVVLISNPNNEGAASTAIAGYPVGLTTRTLHPESEETDATYRVRRLVSPRDEYLDLSAEEESRALEYTYRRWEENLDKSKGAAPTAPAGLMVRRVRPVTRGLLLLYVLRFSSREGGLLPGDGHANEGSSGHLEDPVVGFAISFPGSNYTDRSAVEYVVNTIWQQEMRSEE